MKMKLYAILIGLWLIVLVSADNGLAQNDAGVTGIAPGNRLSLWSLFQNGKINFEGSVKNYTPNLIDSVRITVQLFDNFGSNLFSGTTSVYYVDTVKAYSLLGTFTPASKGLYTLKAYSTIPLINDVNHNNDTLYGYFNVNDSVLARDYADYGPVLTTQTYFPQPVAPTLMGQEYTLLKPAEITSVSFTLVHPLNVGDSLYAVIYDVLPNGFPNVQIAQTVVHYITPADTADTVSFTLLMLNGPFTLQTGKFYVGVREVHQVNIETTSRVFTKFTTYNKSFSTGFAWIRNEQYGQGDQTYVLRVSFGCVISGETATATPNNVPCGASAQVSVTGSHVGLNYLWSSGAETSLAPNLPTGTYTVTVTDQGGCTLTASTSVIATTPGVEIDSSHIVDVSCIGLSDGSIQIYPGGGTPPFSYAWSTGSTVTSISNLIAGDYTITISDQNNCTGSFSLNVAQPDSLTGTFATVNDNGTGNGIASIIVSGGTPPYSYLWSDGQTTDTATGLNGNAHSVTVTDANACTHNASVTVGFVGISESEAGIESLTINPNPSGGIINLELVLSHPSDVTLTLYTVNAARVYEAVFRNVAAIDKSIALKNPSPGFYIVEIKTSGGVIHKQIIIE